ncbi:MAG: RsbRD N-terminal domain-containing protein [Desulfobacterales bacterium]|nr:RsbRD N-terminal domain-containing protein [Desulfobacterales bacterium]
MAKKTRNEFIASRRDRWIGKWLDALMNTYPNESARFFKDTADPFANPVGAVMRKGITELFEVVTAESYDPQAAYTALEPVIRVRAIQEFSPSAALGFITEIKDIIDRDTAEAGAGQASRQDLGLIAANADRALLTAFDIYVDCKKHVYNLRARQARDSVRQLLIKKELISELPDVDPELTK